jgi:nucleoside-diphosphate-sugar epimerase
MTNHVVVGAGYLGRRVLAKLPAAGATALNRTMPATAKDKSNRWQQIDLDKSQQPALELPARYVVLYTVPPAEEPADSRLRRLLAMLHPVPQRIVYISTSGVYGNCGGRLSDESTRLNPQNERSRRRVAAEEMLRQWCSINVCELLVLRTPAIYGSGRLGLERIRSTMPVLAPDESPPGNRIHVDDLVDCCIAAMDCTNMAGIYNVSDGDFRSASEFAGTVADLAGLPAPPQISREEAKSRFSAARLSFLAESRRLDNTKMREQLGIQPRDPESGIRQSLAH